MTNYVNELWLKWHFLLPQECVYNLLVRERENHNQVQIEKENVMCTFGLIHLGQFFLGFYLFSLWL